MRRWTLLVLALSAAGCVDPVMINKSYDSSRIRRIGIWKFDAKSDLTGGVEDLFAKYMVGGGFQVIERSQIEAVLREQRLGASGALSPDTMKKVGKLLGVDGLVLGSVNYIPESRQKIYVQTQDRIEEPVISTVRQQQPDGSFIEVQKQVGTKVRYANRNIPQSYVSQAQVGITARLVDVETGEIVWVLSDTYEGPNLLTAMESDVAYLIGRLRRRWGPGAVSK